MRFLRMVGPSLNRTWSSHSLERSSEESYCSINVERSQLRCYRHLITFPLGCLPLLGFWVCRTKAILANCVFRVGWAEGSDSLRRANTTHTCISYIGNHTTGAPLFLRLAACLSNCGQFCPRPMALPREMKHLHRGTRLIRRFHSWISLAVPGRYSQAENSKNQVEGYRVAWFQTYRLFFSTFTFWGDTTEKRKSEMNPESPCEKRHIRPNLCVSFDSKYLDILYERSN